MNDVALLGPSKNSKRKYIKSGQKQMAYNVYFNHKANMFKTAAVHQISSEVRISKNNMFEIIKEIEISGVVHSLLRNRGYQDAYINWTKYQKVRLEGTCINFS